MDEFEEVVKSLTEDGLDYVQVDVTDMPFATNCSVSGGMMIPAHENSDCTCEDVPVLFLCITVANKEENLHIAIPCYTPLGIAILSGEFTEWARERVGQFLE